MNGTLVLVGQYDSPFVRRVAVTLHQYGMSFERSVLSTFADFAAMLELSPLGKVPVLVLPDGERLWDSRAILDHLHEGAAPERRLLPESGPERQRALRIEVTGLGLAEKAYERGLEYSRRTPGTQDAALVARFERQIASALSWLERQKTAPFLSGDALGIADITVAVAFTYLRQKLPSLVADGRYPAVGAHCDRCEALPAFRAAPYSATEATKTGWRPEIPA